MLGQIDGISKIGKKKHTTFEGVFFFPTTLNMVNKCKYSLNPRPCENCFKTRAHGQANDVGHDI